MLTYITVSLFHLFCFSLPIFVLSAGNLRPFLSVGKVSAKNPGDLIFKIIWKELVLYKWLCSGICFKWEMISVQPYYNFGLACLFGNMISHLGMDAQISSSCSSQVTKLCMTMKTNVVTSVTRDIDLQSMGSCIYRQFRCD